MVIWALKFWRIKFDVKTKYGERFTTIKSSKSIVQKMFTQKIIQGNFSKQDKLTLPEK